MKLISVSYRLILTCCTQNVLLIHKLLFHYTLPDFHLISDGNKVFVLVALILLLQ